MDTERDRIILQVKDIIAEEEDFLITIQDTINKIRGLSNVDISSDLKELLDNLIQLDTITINNINKMSQLLNANDIDLIKGLAKDIIDNHIQILIKHQAELKNTERIISKHARLTDSDKQNIIEDAKLQMALLSDINVKLLAEKYNCLTTTIYNTLNKYSKEGIRKK